MRAFVPRHWFGVMLAAFMVATCTRASAELAQSRELSRIRISNRECGPIEISVDGGKSYSRVGKVLRPATTTYEGFVASIYAEPSTVTAVAVHGIRIKVGGGPGCERARSQTISVIPSEFANTPNGFGGFVAGSSGIYTDIPTAKGIFRNLAPFVGNPVLRQTSNGLIPLSENYVPSENDVLVIMVKIPKRYPNEIVFENRKGGSVKAVYADGEETVARVERPVQGTGRFDATGYTGVGAINTNHTGVITISTAPIADGGKDGSSHETRGGFMIQPSHHAKGNPEIAQIMVVGSPTGRDEWIEGTPPLFSGYIGLMSDPSSAGRSFRVQVKTASTDWIPMPSIVGVHSSSLMSLPNGKGAVTQIRILFPDLSPAWLSSQVQQASRTYMNSCLAEAKRRGTLISDPVLVVQIDASRLSGVKLVSLYLDGQFRGASNAAPYSFSVDTTALDPGEHVAVVRAVGESGATIRSVTRTFFVQGGGISSGVL